MIPGPTTRGFTLQNFSMARLKVLVTEGTTEDTMAPRMSWGFLWCISRAVLMVTAYSKSVAVCLVDTRSRKRILESWKQPITMLVFPMSMARIICFLLNYLVFSTFAFITARQMAPASNAATTASMVPLMPTTLRMTPSTAS